MINRSAQNLIEEALAKVSKMPTEEEEKLEPGYQRGGISSKSAPSSLCSLRKNA